MAHEIEILQRLLTALSRRERALLLGRAALQGAATTGVVLVVAGALASQGVTRPTLLGVVGGLGGLVIWVALAWPLLPRWRQAGNPVRQAQLVEGAEPRLRGRLLTAIDGMGASQPMMARVVQRATALSVAVMPHQVHSRRVLRQPGWLLGFAMVLLLAATVGLPVGPWRALGVLWGSPAEASMSHPDALVPSGQPVFVGDIVLKYTFPDYTGLEAMEVPNSDGTIHAPPGTQVRISARVGEAWDAVALSVDEGAPTPAQLFGGRDIEAHLEVGGEGTWRLQFTRGAGVAWSPTFPIRTEEDAPPVVTLSPSRDGRAFLDRAIPLGWRVEDDFGIDRVVVEATNQKGETTERVLRDPLEVRRILQGTMRESPRDLGFGPGDTLTLKIAAFDNNQLDGSGRGESTEVELRVLGPMGVMAELKQYREALRDAYLDALAPFLTEALPPALDRKGMSRWVGSARARFEKVEAVIESQWHGETPGVAFDAEVITSVRDAASRLFRFTQTTFDPNLRSTPTSADLETFVGLHQTNVGALESAIYRLDYTLTQAAFHELAKLSRNAASQARQIREEMGADPEASQLLARLDQLERFMREMLEKSAQLGEGSLREFVNSRGMEALGLVEQIREAIAEGRLDDAQSMMNQLAENLDQIATGFEEQLQGPEDTEDLQGQMDDLMAELESLQEAQDTLAGELQQAREAHGSELDEAIEQWSRLDELAGQLMAEAAQADSKSGFEAGWRVGTLRRLSTLATGAQVLQQSISSRASKEALEDVRRAARDRRIASDLVVNEQRRPRVAEEAPPSLEAVAGHLDKAKDIIAEMQSLLEEMEADPQQVSQELREAAQSLSERQNELNERQEQLEPDVQSMERQMPTGNGEAQAAMEQVGQSMDQASQALQEGEPMPAEGYQQEASRRIQEVRDALQQQMQQMQQMQQATEQMQSGGGGEKQDSGKSNRPKTTEIPAPEAFRTPEEYRRALLEGMEGQVPEEYRALKKRYYEELVRQ